MTNTQGPLGQARLYLSKAEEYLASAADNLSQERHTVCAGDAVHAGICAKDAIVTALTGQTVRGKDHTAAVKELRSALGRREMAADAERALRDLVGAKTEVEYSVEAVTAAKAKTLLRRAKTLVELARSIVKGGGA